MAGGAPVRRYNATSARTLAVYMASQDNPEQGLCHHPSVNRSLPQMKVPSKPKKQANGSVQTPEKKERSSGQESSGGDESKAASAREIHPHGNDITKGRINSNGLKDEEPMKLCADSLKSLDEPTSTDHRSFVQNVFGTTAFKMLEWLTPRSLELLSRPEEIAKPVERDNPTLSPKDLHNSRSNEQKEKSNSFSAKRSSSEGNMTHEPAPVKVTKEEPSSKPSPRNSKTPPSLQDSKSKPASKPTQKQTSSSHRHKKSESLEDHHPKGILNIPSRPSDASMDMTLPQFRPSHTKQKISRQSSTTSPQLHVAEITSITAGKSSSVRIITEPKKVPPMREDDPDPKESKEEAIFTATVNVENIPQRIDASRLPSIINSPSCPQSMSYLPIELIEFLCDVMHTDSTAEKHDLEPMAIDDKAVKISYRPYPKSKRRDLGLSDRDSTALKERWRSFIEQSFFDVLSKPDSLLQSFKHSDGQLFDTHTIWYLMLRMTRVAPSIVFHSLWNVAGVLFNIPDKLETVHDWAKPPENNSSSKSLSNQEAAEVMSICLHALVAAAPLVSNARQLANMSRIRSYGLTMLGLEPVDLCLAYEDAFTNELALRLARRLFASIPTRRRFSKLLDVQNDVRNNDEREPDVLEALLAKLKFLDLDITPMLSFDLNERDLHEKRVPTLLLDWARTVMHQDWQGSAEVPAEGAFGGALALIAAICMYFCPFLGTQADYLRQT